MPSVLKAPTSEPPVAPQPVAKALPHVACAALTSDEVKKERVKASAAMKRKLVADMAVMQQQMNTMMMEEEQAAADEDLYT